MTRLCKLWLLSLALLLVALYAFGFTPSFLASVEQRNITNAPASDFYQIPTNNRSLWQAGVIQGIPGGIPTNQTHITNIVTHYGADTNGVTACNGLITTALSDLPTNGVLYFPPGLYNCGSGYMAIPNGRVIRGAGKTLTILSNLQFSGGVDNSAYRNNPQNGHIITAGATKGSTNITVTWRHANYTDYPMVPGRTVMDIRQHTTTNQSDEFLEVRIGWTPSAFGHSIVTNGSTAYSYRTLHVVTATNDTSISFWPPLPKALRENGGSYGRAIPDKHNTATPFFRIGVEDLTMKQTAAIQTALFMGAINQPWAKNVRFIGYTHNAIYWYDCLNFQIQGCDADMNLESPASNGAGFKIEYSTFGLVEDNFVTRMFPCLQIDGSSANIFAYNAFFNTNGGGSTLHDFNETHAPHNAFNLYEGNMSRTFWSDGYFGGSSHSTIYRGWVHGTLFTNLALGESVRLNRFARQYHFAYNIFERPAPFTSATFNYTAGYPGQSAPNATNAPPWPLWGVDLGTFHDINNDWLENDFLGVSNTCTFTNNYHYFNNAISNAVALQFSNSLYLAAAPNWWTNQGGGTWPPFTPGTTPKWTNLPAGQRMATLLTNDPAWFFIVNGFYP